MALFSKEELQNYSSEKIIYESEIARLESLSIEGLEAKEAFNYDDEFDIFLSHSYKDKG